MSDAAAGRAMLSVGYGQDTALNHLIKVQQQDERMAPLLGWFRAETWALPRYLDFIALIKVSGKCLNALHGYLAACRILSCLMFSHATRVCHFFDS